MSERKVAMVAYFFDYAFFGPKESRYDHLVGYLSYKGHQGCRKKALKSLFSKNTEVN